MKRGRPKGRSKDQRSFGPLGDLIRRRRLECELGLADVAGACGCSVQFISNIEHGRAPLPWDKVPGLAACLNIPIDELQAANLSVRSDFRSFVGGIRSLTPAQEARKRTPTRSSPLTAPAELLAAALTTRDRQLRAVIERYQAASPASRRRFLKAALAWLAPTS
jgi:transcriptional regulator with XRE-family HTH domain